MKTADIIRRAGLNLRQAKVRTILTSLGISVGAFTITIALAAGAAGREITNSLVETSGDDAALSVYKEVDYDQQVSGPVNLDAEEVEVDDSLSMRDMEIIEAVHGVERVIPNYYVSAEYMTREGQDRYMAPLTIKVDRTELRLAAGSLKDYMLEPGKIAIPDTYLEALGLNDTESAIGQSVTVRVGDEAGEDGRDLDFVIGAVYTKTQETIYFEETIYLSVEDGKSIYDYQSGDKSDNYFGFKVHVATGHDPKAVQTAIEDSGEYHVYSQRDERETLMTMVNVMQWGLVGVGGIAILASIFGIINTQYISVLERTRQIGLMKSLGASRRDIARLFRYEAAWVGFLGAIIGTVLALVASLANDTVVGLLELDEGTRLLIFEPLSSLALVAGLMLVAVLAGYFPSRKAARLDPVEALKYE